MSATAALWCVGLVIVCMMTVVRARWGLTLYLYTFFAFPPMWWWGKGLPDLRYSLLSGVLFLGSVFLHTMLGNLDQKTLKPEQRKAGKVLLFGLANMLVVHTLFADVPEESIEQIIENAKFVLLFFMITYAIQTREDFTFALTVLCLCASYIGYEATINERGDYRSGRLEGLGVPGANLSNQLASLMVTILPPIGVLAFIGNKKTKFVAAVCCAFILNIVMQCNSRGAFLSLGGSSIFLLLVARGQARKQAFMATILGGLLAFSLMGDPRIIERFLTTFTSEGKRDNSAASRLVFWGAGIEMIGDNPLGSGGYAFKRGEGSKYLAKRGIFRVRAVHNGYINETVQWGIQGIILRLLFTFITFRLAWITMKRALANNRGTDAFVGACLMSAWVAFSISSMFGDFIDKEWAIWLGAFCVVYARFVTAEIDAASAEAEATAESDEDQNSSPRRLAPA